MNNKLIGEHIKRLREKAGINQAQLAKLLNIAPPRISELESNKREMSLNELKAYHNYFHVSFEYLLGENNIENNNVDFSLTELSKSIHENAINHGWWEESRTIGDIVSLCHCELSEAIEEYRNGHAADEVYYNGSKPEGVPIELIDCMIRILDYLCYLGVDIEPLIAEKMTFNSSRPYKHSGKVM